METEIRLQEAVEATEIHEATAFSAEEVELACDAPVTVYGRMQP